MPLRHLLSVTRNPGWPVFLAVAILGLNLFLVSPWLFAHTGPNAANGEYVAVRVVVLIGLCWALCRNYGRARFQAMAAAAFVAFIDQVLFKGLSLTLEMHADPATWAGASAGGIAFGLFASFMLFLPMVLLISFIGTEIPHWIGKRPRPAPSL